MPDKDITVQVTKRTADVLDLLSDGDTDPLATNNDYHFENDGATLILVERGSTAANLVIKTPATVDGLDVTDRTIALQQGTMLYGPFPKGVYNDSAGKVEFSLSAVADIGVAVVRLG